MSRLGAAVAPGHSYPATGLGPRDLPRGIPRIRNYPQLMPASGARRA